MIFGSWLHYSPPAATYTPIKSIFLSRTIKFHGNRETPVLSVETSSQATGVFRDTTALNMYNQASVSHLVGSPHTVDLWRSPIVVIQFSLSVQFKFAPFVLHLTLV